MAALFLALVMISLTGMVGDDIVDVALASVMPGYRAASARDEAALACR